MSNSLYNYERKFFAASANGNSQSFDSASRVCSTVERAKTLYTADERQRRDATKWTLVQGVLAPVQFVIFLISLALVVRCLATGEGFAAATASVVIKTIALYAIMVTGAIWEREVFGVYLFARAFFWEDAFSFVVIALHTAYLVALFFGLGDHRDQMLIALAAYATYVVNATQFILKLRAARRDEVAALSAARSAHSGGLV
ncbi:2-vinyl bacteriochlorophyllide hydratase [Afipia sp. DC4300-2b1]|uniref:2-vinyl bacteriochlorophyllide hydratase n=1 Tax=Afipia sp. DC4300-2b1 TaxID=2804672 RepID=UPI003CEC9467